MIRNARQYRITQTQVGKLEQALAQVMARHDPGIPLRLQQAEREALHSQIADLREQLAAYEALRARQQTVFTQSFDELPRALIQARIAMGLSQKELAARLGLKEQQIQRYEATEYASANLARVRAVIQALGITIREEIVLPRPVHAAGPAASEPSPEPEP